MTDDTMTPVSDDDCPICAKPFKADDLCATDIEMGTCHAECLEGSPAVNLETGDPSDGPIATFTYGSLPVPKVSDDELVARLDEEAMRLSGRSMDNGCADSGIASNLADEAAARLRDLSAARRADAERIAELEKALEPFSEALASLSSAVDGAKAGWVPNKDYDNEATWPPVGHPLGGLFHNARLQYPYNAGSRAEYECIVDWLASPSTGEEARLRERVETWRRIETCKNFGFEHLFYSPGNPTAQNENARTPYQVIDTLTPYSPGGGRSYPEAPYTHWRPLLPNPTEEI